MKTAVLSVGWLLLRLLRSASCCFCNSRKNRCCFSRFLVPFPYFIVTAEKVFPFCFFLFFGGFFLLKLKLFFFVFFLMLKEFFPHFFLLKLYLEPHHLRKHFFKVFHFLDLKKRFSI